MDDRISVLMGIYNSEDSVRNAVMTIEQQTDKNIEFVICDDCSTDRTFEILKELAVQYPNIVLLRNKRNHGLAYSLNRCFRCSHGKYLARMDADDLCKPERFARQRAFLEAHPEYDLVGTEMILVDEHGRETFSKHRRRPTVNVLPISVPFAHPTVLMRRYVLEALGGYSVEKYTRRCEDLELWYRFFRHGFRGCNLPDYLYIKAQGIEDYKRRKVKHGFEMCYIHLRELRLNHAPFYKYFLAVKPVVAAMVPKHLMKLYHGFVFRDKNV